jgi:hypothetical protein
MGIWPADRRAVFSPKRRDNLRPSAIPFIGQEIEWSYVGTSEPDEAFPGQKRWLPTMGQPAHDAHLGWVPDEDLEGVPTEQEADK